MPVALAPAKVNLTLRVTGKRDDGYHLLDSLVAFVSFGDRVTVSAPNSGKTRLSIDGPYGTGLPTDESNLVLQAAQALAALCPRSVAADIHLEKHLPIAAGIGGGSADAAACLQLLNDFWGVGLDADALANLGLSLGADVPACLERRPVRMTGIGEILTPLPRLPSLGILLVNDGTACPTGPVFKARSAPFSQPRDIPDTFATLESLIAFLRADQNDLEAPAQCLHPSIGTVLARVQTLEDCQLARMSGSGATVFGLFPTQDSAEEAATRLRQEKGWWAVAGSL